ncbi:hypothetical protein E3O53_07900 [Cryobacterium sp. TMT2-18-3]|uniref:hypothetical protein n=1 Tax=unclassified Cryobacterium TaxID=2649013 RepID=UPI00106BEADB|nr:MULTISPECIES: hypothetical protein [unclassified Cryobacterium]TFC26430.1 hypothetical protein E3O22_12410 [Cryobacterium sp. TMT2-18-2]TFC64392.1 hypothetical protein E3O53_07900 [Cryobacterium sp. TMT2-18-3]
MTPDDVVADPQRLLRFQNEVAYLDRMWPPDDEVRADTELLGSKKGTSIVAWLWPTEDHRPGSDPFAAALQEDQELLKRALPSHHLADANGYLEAASRAVDRCRERRRHIVAIRFQNIIESIAREVSRTVEEVKTHLVWSVSLSQLELERMLDGLTPFSFGVIVRLCDALRLEFAGGWVIDDPRLLARRIDLSVRASAIGNRLRFLTLENLTSIEKRLPRLTVDAGQSPDLDDYRAPALGGRYSSFYEVLAADARDRPEYALTQIDRFLLDAGELGLPDSARKGRSWWAGSGAKIEGRPQISAWWGAGYKVERVSIDSFTDEVVSIRFEALPRRAEWFANPGRTLQREYRPPGPDKVRIYPDLVTLSTGHQPDLDERVLALASQFDFEGFQKALSPVLESLDALRRSYVPDDPDMRNLTQFLDSVGEADRFQIERHFSLVRNEPLDAAWLTNLLTKARRQGWTMNKGTRKQPRWAALRLRALLLDDIAANLRLEPPAIDPKDAVPVEFLHRVAEAVDLPSANSSAAQVARLIVESKGGAWQPGFESADESVTSLGLKAVQDAVGMRMPPEDEIGVLA